MLDSCSRVTSWFDGIDFGQQGKSLLDFGKAEIENSDSLAYIKRYKCFIYLNISKYRSFLEIQKQPVFLATYLLYSGARPKHAK